MARDVDRRLGGPLRPGPSEPDYRLAFDDALAAMFLTSLLEPTAGQALRVNRALCNLVGYTEAELTGSGFRRVIHPDDRHESELLLQRLISGEQPPGQVARRYLHADGHEIWASVSISVARDDDSRPACALTQIHDITDRNDLGAESRAVFWDLASNVNIGFALRQVAPLRFLYVNPVFLGMFGWDPQDAQPSPAVIINQIHAEDRGRVVQAVEAAPVGQTVETEVRIIRPDGELRWLWFRAGPIADNDGVIDRIAIVIQDITERKGADAALRHSEALFQQLASGLEVGFALRQLDPPEVLYANRAYLTIFGFDAAGPLPTVAEVAERVHPDDAARGWQALEVNELGQAVEQEVRVIRPDGEQRLLAVNVRPIVDEDGTVRRVTTHVQDITDRRAAEAEIRESRARLDQLARSTEVGFLLRSGLEILYVNAGLGRILGYDTFDPGKQTPALITFVHPGDRDRAAQVGDRAQRGESSAAELRIVRADGELRWVSIKYDPVATAPGEPSRVATTVIDITDRKAAEEALVAAKEQAEQANAAKDQYLSRMSHELRTPLNAILGFGQLLEIDQLSPEQHDSVERIIAAGEHLLGLIDEILDISTAERGHMRLSLEPVRIRDVTDEAVGMLRPLAQRSGVQITVDELAVDEQVYVRADRQRLRQVLVNLLANAVHYSHTGGEVRIGAEQADPGRVRLLVIDTGIGIAENDLDRLFQPFERLTVEGSSVDGTGLGLALTRSLMTAMAGTVGVNSRLGDGSTFWIDLPIAEAPADRRDERPRRAHTSGPASTAVARALYIEDNLSNVTLMERVLARRPGISLDVATNGRDGLDMALTQQPDLVLLDLHLPDISGSDVLRSLRADPRTADTPVVMISADATHGQRERLLTQGATEYLTKPIDIHRLLATIDNLTVAPPPGRGPDRDNQQTEPARHPPGTHSYPTPRRAGEDRDAALFSFVHDLNNLLGVILTYCALVASEATDVEMVSDLGTIRESAQAAVALTRHLVSAPDESGPSPS